MVYMLKFKINDLNCPKWFPNFDAVRTVERTCEVYTNDRHQRLFLDRDFDSHNMLDCMGIIFMNKI